MKREVIFLQFKKYILAKLIDTIVSNCKIYIYLALDILPFKVLYILYDIKFIHGGLVVECLPPVRKIVGSNPLPGLTKDMKIWYLMPLC